MLEGFIKKKKRYCSSNYLRGELSLYLKNPATVDDRCVIWCGLHALH